MFGKGKAKPTVSAAKEYIANVVGDHDVSDEHKQGLLADRLVTRTHVHSEDCDPDCGAAE
ncbi:hypothetical protein [Streptomyces sp. NPDC088775]|uniref:hypothetical protein n=1 Tax=Streptomyces sp. NPDC088775 TaxID=3365896 RepID=UPI00382686FB